MATIKMKISNGMMTVRKKETNAWSVAWATFEEIHNCENENQGVHFVRCTKCLELVYKPTSNTNPLLRHKCHAKKNNCMITPKDKSILKLNAAQFIAKDIRPYFAVECEGLLDLCTACMEFGQSHRKATRFDLAQAMPSRNTVKAAVKEIAKNNRDKISKLIKCAIETGGVAATTDTWKDDYRKATYISVVGHLTCEEKGYVLYHRHVLSTSEITELVKTGSN